MMFVNDLLMKVIQLYILQYVSNYEEKEILSNYDLVLVIDQY